MDRICIECEVDSNGSYVGIIVLMKGDAVTVSCSWTSGQNGDGFTRGADVHMLKFVIGGTDFLNRIEFGEN